MLTVGRGHIVRLSSKGVYILFSPHTRCSGSGNQALQSQVKETGVASMQAATAMFSAL